MPAGSCGSAPGPKQRDAPDAFTTHVVRPKADTALPAAAGSTHVGGERDGVCVTVAVAVALVVGGLLGLAWWLAR